MADGRRARSYFDVGYGLASAAINTTGTVIIATTEASYHGISVIAGTTQLTINLYDNASATSGNIVDIVRAEAGGHVLLDRFVPVMAKNGLTAGVTGTGAVGAIFFGPKG